MFSTFNSTVKAPLVRSGLLRCPPPELLSCDVQFKQIEVGSLGAISPAADPFFPVKTHLAVNKDFARSLAVELRFVGGLLAHQPRRLQRSLPGRGIETTAAAREATPSAKVAPQARRCARRGEVEERGQARQKVSPRSVRIQDPKAAVPWAVRQLSNIPFLA